MKKSIIKKKLFTIILAFFVVFGANAQRLFVSQNKTKENIVSVDKSPNSATILQRGVNAQWDQLFTFNSVESASPGVETNGIHFYTTTWNAGNFHRYDMDGSNPVTFTVAGAASVRDMAYDGTYFYGAAADMNLFKMDLENEKLVNTITATCTGITGIRHIAYDPTLDGGNGGFWIGDWTELGAIAMDGSEVYPNINVAEVTDCYGSAYDTWTDPANPKLWLFQQPLGAQAIFYEFDINTMAMTGVTHEVSNTKLAGGACTYEAGGKFIIVGNTQEEGSLNTITAFELASTVNPTAPAEVTAFTGTPDATGALTIDLTWTNPTLDVSGNALTELTSVDLYIYGTPAAIYTNGSPTIGGADTYTATVAQAGNYTFIVTGTNTAGEGIPTLYTVYIGEDIPVAPGNVVLTNPSGLNATVTWDAPTTGINGGYINPANITYEVFRNGTTSVYTGTDLTFTETLVDAGNFFYTVVASNNMGTGGMGTSNSLLIGDFVVFDFESGMPSNFTLIDGTCGWLTGTDGSGVSFTIPPHTTYAYASDDVCEGEMSDVWMITPAIDFTGITTPFFQFECFSGNDLYTIKATTDGNNWTDITTIGSNLSAWRTETVDLSAYANAPYVKIAFHYNDIGAWGWAWAVDDIYFNGVLASASTNATLSNLTIDGSTVMGFNPTTMSYDVELASGTTVVPTVVGTPTDANANAMTTDATTLPGASTVLVTAEDGTTQLTYTINFTVGVAVNDIASKGISVYPNPSNGTFTVNVKNNFNLEILDITGKLINSRIINKKSTISIENAGVYFLKFSNEEGSVTQKVIVQ